MGEQENPKKLEKRVIEREMTEVEKTLGDKWLDQDICEWWKLVCAYTSHTQGAGRKEAC